MGFGVILQSFRNSTAEMCVCADNTEVSRS